MRTGEHRIGMLGLVGEAGTVPERPHPDPQHEDSDVLETSEWGVSTIGPHGTMLTTPGNGPIRWVDRSHRFRTRLRITEGRALIELEGTLGAETSWPLYAAVGSAVSHRVRRIVVDARLIDMRAEGTACLRSVRRTGERFGVAVDVVRNRPPAA